MEPFWHARCKGRCAVCCTPVCKSVCEHSDQLTLHTVASGAYVFGASHDVGATVYEQRCSFIMVSFRRQVQRCLAVLLCAYKHGHACHPTITTPHCSHALLQWDSPRWHSSHPHRAQVEACTTERDRRMLRCEVVCSVYPGNPTGHQQMVETDSRPAALPLPTYHHRSVDVQLLGLQYGGCEFHVL